ncbi:hypothetical protein GCM10010269_05880 [Streptomyces humidus]|uniref:Uncharacterized protein n=1 Tax=Streptomyces humidus TaxID=52259 RepID=A0A918FS80_9ACTN|nr:hypothetical protein GCM10010269_05880 [Streptomyces humidus]
MLSAKLLEPTTTVSPAALSPASGSEVSSDEEEHPASRAVIAARATAVAPGWLLRDLLLWALEVTVPVPGCGVDENSNTLI